MRVINMHIRFVIDDGRYMSKKLINSEVQELIENSDTKLIDDGLCELEIINTTMKDVDFPDPEADKEGTESNMEPLNKWLAKAAELLE